MPDRVRVVVAEDQPLFLSAIRAALQPVRSIEVVAEAADGVSALASIRTLRPELAILDIRLPELDGLAVVRALRQDHLPVEIVFLTVCEDDESFEEAIALGAKGYLLKECTDDELRRCVLAVASGRHYTSPSMTTYLMSRVQRVEQFRQTLRGLTLLTAQEREILRRIAQDKTSKEVAEEMGITPRTVDAHRSNICRKLDIHGQHALTRFAARHRIEI
jgi:DNA-binding NarL/FixJ family response regulator